MIVYLFDILIKLFKTKETKTKTKTKNKRTYMMLCIDRYATQRNGVRMNDARFSA